MYSQDLRKVALRLYASFQSLRKVAKLLNTSHSTISRWIKSPTRKLYGPRKKQLDSEVFVTGIRSAIQADPFISLRKLRILLHETCGILVSHELLRIAIRQLGWSKKVTRFYGKPTYLEERTRHFVTQRDQYMAEGRPFVSIDETSFGRHVAPVKGYAKRGHRLYVCKRVAHVQNHSVCAAMSEAGWVHYEIRRGAYTRASFLGFLQQLKGKLPAHVVLLMDNVRFHHSLCIKEYIQQQGWSVLYTPPYSPWYNPIEGAFSIVKKTYGTQSLIPESFASLTPSHAAAFFRHSFTFGPEHPSKDNA